MQAPIELSLLANIASGILSIIVGAYLLIIWYRQQNRLRTDLPVLFGITFMAQAVSRMIYILPLLSITEMTMELFRLRALIISGSAIPMLAGLLQIWAPKINHLHNRIAFVFLLYWSVVTLLSPTQELIMTLVMPLIMVFGISMIATFAITWKTGRLKEIRSDLMVFSLVIGIFAQALQVPLMITYLFYIPDVLTTISILGITLALTNPWFNRQQFQLSDQIEPQASIISS
jgi:hypothetical protein